MGLEISVLKFSDVLNDSLHFRIDSEYFEKIFLQNEIAISKKPFKRILDVSTVADGDHSKFPAYQKSEVKYLQSKDIKKYFLNDADVYVSKSYFDNNKRSHIFEENILISIMGNVGDITITPKGFTPSIANRAVAILKHIKNINPYFLFSYLTTSSANLQIERHKNGGVQERINLELLGTIRLPICTTGFQLEIENIITLAHSYFEQSKNLYNQAEQILLQHLSLYNWQPNEENTSIKKFSESFDLSGRLDSEYYQPKYLEIELKIKNYNKGWCLIKDVYIHVTDTFERVKEKYNYIEIGDIDVSNGSVQYNEIDTTELPANAKIVIKKDDILVSNVRPYRGAISIIEFDKVDLVCSGAFTVLREKNKDFLKEYIAILLRTNVYKEWLLQFNVGTSYPVIKDDDVLNMPIPCLPIENQKELANQIQQSFELRKESARLIEIAKQAVEIAIEKDEETALNYIKEKEAKLN